jgi:hypothetical protein
VKGHDELANLKADLNATWQPLSFSAFQVSLIWRRDPPDDRLTAAWMIRPVLGTTQEGAQE